MYREYLIPLCVFPLAPTRSVKTNRRKKCTSSVTTCAHRNKQTPQDSFKTKKKKTTTWNKQKRKHFSLMLAHILGQFAQKSKYTGAEALVHFAPLKKKKKNRLPHLHLHPFLVLWPVSVTLLASSNRPSLSLNFGWCLQLWLPFCLCVWMLCVWQSSLPH